MKHLLEFESYSPVNEATIPVYKESELEKNPNAGPEMKVPEEDLIGILDILLNSQEEGKIDMIVVSADLPKQGKNAPEYLRGEIETERERMAKRKYAIYGSRIEASDRPEDDYADAINLFVDTEFVLVGVSKEDEEDCAYVIPRSLYQKTQRDPSLTDKYKLSLKPSQIDEVSYYD